MDHLKTKIEAAWENRELLKDKETTDAIREVITLLDEGKLEQQSRLKVDGR
mgnify:CR=1 FL=1